MLGIRRRPSQYVEKEQGYQQESEMQCMLCQPAGACETFLERTLEAKSVQVQRVQEPTASIQVRHSKVEAMGGEFYALLSAVWKLRLGNEDQCADNDMQSVP